MLPSPSNAAEGGRLACVRAAADCRTRTPKASRPRSPTHTAARQACSSAAAQARHATAQTAVVSALAASILLCSPPAATAQTTLNSSTAAADREWLERLLMQEVQSRLHSLPEQELKATVEQLLSASQRDAAPSLLAAPKPMQPQAPASPASQRLHLPELPPLPSANNVIKQASAAWSAASSAFGQLQHMTSTAGISAMPARGQTAAPVQTPQLEAAAATQAQPVEQQPGAQASSSPGVPPKVSDKSQSQADIPAQQLRIQRQQQQQQRQDQQAGTMPPATAEGSNVRSDMPAAVAVPQPPQLPSGALSEGASSPGQPRARREQDETTALLAASGVAMPQSWDGLQQAAPAPSPSKGQAALTGVRSWAAGIESSLAQGAAALTPDLPAVDTRQLAAAGLAISDEEAQDPPSSSQPAAEAPPPSSTPSQPVAGRQSGPAWMQGWQQQLQLLPALLLAKAQPLMARKQAAPAAVQSAAQPPEQAAARQPGQARAAQGRPDRLDLLTYIDRPQRQGPQHSQHSQARFGSESEQPAPDAPGSRVLWRRHASAPIPAGPAPRPAVNRQLADSEPELAAWPSAGKQAPVAGGRQAGDGPVPGPSPQAGPGSYRALQLVDFWATPRPEAPGSSVLLPSNGSKASHASRPKADQTHGAPQSNGARRQPGDVGGRLHRQSSGRHAPGEGHGQGTRDVARSRQPPPMPHGSAPEVQSGAAAGRNGSMHGKSGTPAAHSGHEREAGRSQPSSQLWDNFESMDDDTISGVIEAARRAGVRRRMWDS